MPQLPFLVMTSIQAARFRDETAGDLDRLDPREVEAGPHKGKFVLPERVVFDPAHEARHDALRMLEVVALDPDIAWPEVEVQRAGAS